jgi:chemotaxis protein MotB
MKVLRLIVVFFITSMILSGCVTSKKFNAQTAELEKTKNDLDDCQTNLAKGLIANKKLGEDLKDLKDQVVATQLQLDSCTIKAAAAANNKGNGSELITTLKDMNVLTDDQAQSIDQSLKTLSQGPVTKESLTTALVANIKSSIGGNDDTDISVVSDKGNLYIDLTDHIFFSSGSSDLTARAKMIIGKVAKILNSYPDMHFMIEGHTDSRPIHNTCVPDNWDLSIRRATSVIRLLQKVYKVDPTRMIAAGRGEYDPAQPNDSAAHRAQNRRISIVMTPQLDQFFKLLVKK